MSAAEFGQWMEFAAHEPFGLGHLRQTIARVLAAIYNGALIRKDQKTWQPSDFDSDPWVEPEAMPTDAKSLKAMFGRR